VTGCSDPSTTPTAGNIFNRNAVKVKSGFIPGNKKKVSWKNMKRVGGDATTILFSDKKEVFF